MANPQVPSAQDALKSVTDAFHTIFLAGVGAVAITGEKGSELFDSLVKKGEATVRQGKDTNAELLKKAQDKATDTAETALQSYLRTLSPEDRSKFVASVQKAAANAEAHVQKAVEGVGKAASAVEAEAAASKGDVVEEGVAEAVTDDALANDDA